MKRRSVLIYALTLALVALSGCGGEKKGSAQQGQYSLDNEQVLAFMYADETLTPEENTANIYHYRDLSKVGEHVAEYVRELTGEENGFCIVDAQFVATEAPDFTDEAGSVRLGKNTDEDERAISIVLDWEQQECTVTVSVQHAQVTQPQPAPEMTLIEAVDYVYQLAPKRLGLNGESMQEYSVYGLDGTSFVNGTACVRIGVYTKANNAQTNALLGTYLMSSDGAQIYLLKPDSGGVSAIENA